MLLKIKTFPYIGWNRKPIGESDDAKYGDITFDLEKRFRLFYMDAQLNDGMSLYDFQNKTGYKPDVHHIKKQIQSIKKFSDENAKENNQTVKRVIVVSHYNTSDYPNDAYTNGWEPAQSNKKSKNKNLAYRIEYADGSSTGWLLYSSNTTAAQAVLQAVDPLVKLAECPLCRNYARMARQYCIAAQKAK
ncbi:MAG: hypothetical protein LBF28_01305 [Rickettsiales bacterium]|jgi:hypothetical protein|nr:hypothetical protein [Rickettsiales bacterium]